MLSDEMLYCAYAVIVGDAIGLVTNDEQRHTMVEAVEASGSPMEFVESVTSAGIPRSSQLCSFLMEYVLCPEKYPHTAKLKEQCAATLVGTRSALDLVAPLLDDRQKVLFEELLTDFSAEHRSTLYDRRRKVWRKCKFANESVANDVALPRFYNYCMGIMHGRNKAFRAMFDGFPEETVFSVLSRAYNVAL